LLHTSGNSIVADHVNGEPNEPSSTKITCRCRPLTRQRVSPWIEPFSVRPVCYPPFCAMLMRLGPRPEAFQLPLVIGLARESGRAQYIGRGLNRWSTVHIADVVDLYLLALDKAPAGTFVFVESGEAAFRDMAQAIADALELGDPVSMKIEAAEARWGRPRARYSLASNSRVRSLRTRAWDWSPRHVSVNQWIADHLSAGAKSFMKPHPQ
jgi:hypothetical protein